MKNLLKCVCPIFWCKGYAGTRGVVCQDSSAGRIVPPKPDMDLSEGIHVWKRRCTPLLWKNKNRYIGEIPVPMSLDHPPSPIRQFDFEGPNSSSAEISRMACRTVFPWRSLLPPGNRHQIGNSVAVHRYLAGACNFSVWVFQSQAFNVTPSKCNSEAILTGWYARRTAREVFLWLMRAHAWYHPHLLASPIGSLS